jgi:hypothetical protein
MSANRSHFLNTTCNLLTVADWDKPDPNPVAPNKFSSTYTASDGTITPFDYEDKKKGIQLTTPFPKLKLLVTDATGNIIIYPAYSPADVPSTHTLICINPATGELKGVSPDDTYQYKDDYTYQLLILDNTDNFDTISIGPSSKCSYNGLAYADEINSYMCYCNNTYVSPYDGKIKRYLGSQGETYYAGCQLRDKPAENNGYNFGAYRVYQGCVKQEVVKPDLRNPTTSFVGKTYTWENDALLFREQQNLNRQYGWRNSNYDPTAYEPAVAETPYKLPCPANKTWNKTKSVCE